VANLEELEKAVRGLGQKGDDVEESYLDFWIELLRIMDHAKPLTVPVGEYPLPSAEETEKRLSEGHPMIDVENLEVDKASLETACREICDCFDRYEFDEEKDREKLSGLQALFNMKEFVDKIASRDREYFARLSDRYGLKKVLLVFIAEMLARTVLAPLAVRLRERIRHDDWLKNYCPVCGAAARMAKISDEEERPGARYLQCQVCDSLWRFPRVQCAHCGNADHKSLGFLEIEEDDPYWVDFCRKCQNYIKTVDERKYPGEKPVNLLVEDIGTIGLDLVAEQEGFWK
jgi:FdhE protein